MKLRLGLILLLFAASAGILAWMYYAATREPRSPTGSPWAETLADLDACCRRKHVKSVQYDHFAGIAADEERHTAERLFRAMAFSERLQENNCATAILHLGGHYTPPGKIIIFGGTTDGNLERSVAYERQAHAGRSGADIRRAMEDFLALMPVRSKVEKPVVHISLNPHPDDILTDTELQDIAWEYLEKMGFGNQPYLVFKHEDIDRHHLHIVTVRVDENGRGIDTRNNFYRSKQITRELERKYGLHDAERKNRRLDTPLHKVDTSAGDVKKQVGNIVKAISGQYRFQTMGEYCALLSLYNMTVEEVHGNVRGREYHGLVYSATDDKGNKVGNPFKSSQFGKSVGYEAVLKKFTRSKQDIKDRKLADMTKRTILSVLEGTYDKEKFVATLKGKGIDTVLRYTEEGRIYGATFIDHRTGCVLNGSRMGKELSANALQEHFTLPYAGQPPISLSVPVEEPENRQGYSDSKNVMLWYIIDV